MFTFKGTGGFKKNDYYVKHFRIILMAGLMALLYACSSTDEKPVDTSLKYFPLAVGDYWIYNVVEINFDTLSQDQTLHYQEKYEIIDSYKSQLNENTYVIHIASRTGETDPWNYTQTWSAKVSSLNEVIVNEENVPYIKMLLPVSDGLTWKGNVYNTIESDRNNGRIDNFTIVDFKKAFGDFANTITVQESKDQNFSYKDFRYSTYAENIGLVYRVNTYIDYCDQSSCFGLYIRKHEHSKIQTLVAHAVFVL